MGGWWGGGDKELYADRKSKKHVRVSSDLPRIAESGAKSAVSVEENGHGSNIDLYHVEANRGK